MDANSSFVAQLREIRSNLNDAVRSNNQLEIKLVGPRPSDPSGAPKQVSESVVTLLTEITGLSMQVSKMAARHHEIIGEFNAGGLGQANNESRYA